MWIGNLMLVVLNLPLIGLWVRLLRIPYHVLFPAIVAFSAIGAYSINANTFDLYSISVFGALGYVLIRLGCEPAPLLLGFVLGRMLEEHFRRAMIVSQGDAWIFLTRPISATFLLVAALLLIAIVLPSVNRRRESVFKEDS
jgi:putative tricarboxylic transport membrane protein